ncbi:serine/threonine-protein kinase [Streptomyces sp. NPDC059443]|uniref:serine/threonine-protein kinase n=1 Tax=unclassified Streptomyces TaxID=2593676 RepID=UPI003681348E
MDFGGGLPVRIGHYTVERELGAGGMGIVYLARSRGGRAVAVKVARPELALDPRFRERFRAEVAAARKVGGFHTAQVVDADADADPPWLATAYVPGPTLSALLSAEGPMDEARLRQLAAALAEALEAIHAGGLVHRDLKPGNIIMADDGPRVLDFGIARAVESTHLTTTGSAFGTPGFLAPEQAMGLEVTGAADVFALGAVLVAAAGGSAFGGGTPMGLMYRSVHEPADLSRVPAGMRPVVSACLAKDPAHRPTPLGLLDLLVPSVASAPPTVAAAPETAWTTRGGARDEDGDDADNEDDVDDADDVLDRYAVDERDAAFIAADETSSVVMDGDGVVLDSDKRNVQFAWNEIRAVEHAVESPNQLKISVVRHDGARFHCRVDARRPAVLQEWSDRLEYVLALFG